MPLPKELGRFNKKVSNRLMRPLARRAPGFGVLRHQGRKTGIHYETPLNIFRDDDRFIVALTYGDDVDWVKNASTSDASQIATRGRVIDVGKPYEVSTEEGMASIPAPVRLILEAVDVTGFLAFPLAD